MKKLRNMFWVWAVLIAAVSSYPNLKSPIKFAENISWDKVAHFCEYMVLAYLYYKYKVSAGLDLKSIKKHLIYMLLIIPIIDEAHQLLIPGRSFSFLDMLADALGFATIILLITIKQSRLQRCKE
ncbi:MAG TPA: VanZ family protein [Candidatus Cloacimonadota bacterium]|nr:VanZ family protein [Candidatus Cloacimonadota bacterium]HOQ79796.1 VanZ family protein [Candidatus Cloacimonadota bacterium]